MMLVDHSRQLLRRAESVDDGAKLTLRERLAYGLGDTACNLISNVVMSFLLFYYTDVFGLTAEAAGTLFLGVRVIDAVADLSVGAAADRTRTRWGKFRPWLLWFAAPLAFILVMTFTVPAREPGAKLAYAWLTYLLLMLAFSAVNLPYSALSAVMTDDAHERTSLAGIRMVGAQIGALMVAAGTLPLVRILSAATGDLALGYERTTIIFGVAAFMMLMITFYGTRERIHPTSDQSGDLRADLSMLAKNNPWLILTCGGVILFIAFSIRQAAVIYYFKYHIGRELGATLFLSISSVAAITGAMLSVPLSRRLGKRGTFRAGCFVTAGFWGLLLWVPRDNQTLLELINALGSLSMFVVMPLAFSMLGDTADYGEWKWGRRATGIVFSASSFASKVGLGVGGAITATVLGAYGYRPGIIVSPSAIHGIVLMASVIPAIGALVPGWLIGHYSLDERQSAVMRSELADRRAKFIAT